MSHTTGTRKNSDVNVDKLDYINYQDPDKGIAYDNEPLMLEEEQLMEKELSTLEHFPKDERIKMSFQQA